MYVVIDVCRDRARASVGSLDQLARGFREALHVHDIGMRGDADGLYLGRVESLHRD
jgi:hypothetical protein